MDAKTRYAYERRIKELERKVSDLENYKTACGFIYNECVSLATKDFNSIRIWFVFQTCKMLWK